MMTRGDAKRLELGGQSEDERYLRGARLLLVEDDESLREVLSMNLEDLGMRVDGVRSAEEGLELAREALRAGQPYPVALTDVKLPQMSGLELVSALAELDPRLNVVVLTAFGGAEPSLEAMRRGAFHYVEKPINLTSLGATLARALQRERPREPLGESPLIAASPAMNEVLRVVDRVASSGAPVLILGESGVGKELIARALHERSQRAARPFVTVNCAAIPSELLESTLFGHERGAFTGAQQRREGKFKAADGGSLFLDEIAEMSPALQAKLLRVLQDGIVERVGSTSPERVDVRVVTATHQDLAQAIERGAFRADLYYRLNVVPLLIPPLRERREDIPVLARFFIRQLESAPIELDDEVDQACLAYDWPGNVRELRNLVERMLLLREGDRLTAHDLPRELRALDSLEGSLSGAEALERGAVSLPGLRFSLPPDELDLKALERAVILEALKLHEGNQSACARYLKIPRHALLYRLEKFTSEGE